MIRLLQLLMVMTTIHVCISQPLSWTSRGIGGGGAMFATSISPHDQQTLHVACDMSQMFKSADFGNTWTIYPYTMLGGGNYSGHIAYTSNPSIMYTLSKRGDNTIPVSSLDGGTTWTPIKDPTNGSAYYLFANPHESNSLFMTDYSNAYYSIDGGKNWKLVFTEQTPGADGCYIAGAVWDGPNILIATQAGIYASTDNGASFKKDARYTLPAGSGFLSLTHGSNNGLTRLTCITQQLTTIYPGITGADYAGFNNLYTMDIMNGQPSNWISKKSNIPANTFPFFCKMAINDPETIYLAGGNSIHHPSVLKSDNAGNTFTSVFLSQNNANIATGWSGTGGDRDWTYGEYVLGFSVCATNPKLLIAADLGFVHTSSDGGVTWKQAYVRQTDMNAIGQSITQKKSYQTSGLENTAAWTLHWTNPTTMLCGNTDIKGIRSTDGGMSWQHVFNTFSFNTVYSFVQKGTILYAATSTVHDLYQSTYLTDIRIDNGKGTIIMSTDNGSTWSNKWDMNHVVSWITLDAQDSNTMYASIAHSKDGGIYVNNNISGGGTWTKLATPPRTEGHPLVIRSLKDGSLVVSYSGRRVGSAFTASSGVFYSTDKGKTWIDKSSNEMKYWTKDIVIDPHDPLQKTWYACSWSGWGGAPNGLGGLYRTRDRGNTWSRILDLPSRAQNTNRVSSCTVHPLRANEMYVTTESDGLWYTADLQQNTPTFTALATYPFRQPERVFFNPYAQDEVWITSFGNGMRIGATSAPTVPTVELIHPMMDTLIAYSNNRPIVSVQWTGTPENTIMSSQIRFSTSSSFKNVVDTISTTSFTLDIPASIPGKDSIWYMQVRVKSNEGWSTWSSTIQWTFRKLEDPIPLPTITMIEPINDTIISWKEPNTPSMRFKWSAIPEQLIIASQLRFSTSLSFSAKTDTLSFQKEISCELPTFVPGKDTVWYVQARASTKTGWCAWTSPTRITFRKQVQTGVLASEIDNVNLFYPQPVTNALYITDPLALQVEILSLQGNSIWKGIPMNPINVSFLPDGIYCLKLLFEPGYKYALLMKRNSMK